MKFYKIICILTGLLFAFLFTQLLLKTSGFISGLGTEPCQSAIILGRRASIFMLGISVLMAGSFNLQSSKVRQVICASMAVVLLGLPATGTYELIKGTVNSSMIQAIAIEVSLGISFLIVFFGDLKKNRATRKE